LPSKPHIGTSSEPARFVALSWYVKRKLMPYGMPGFYSRFLLGTTARRVATLRLGPEVDLQVQMQEPAQINFDVNYRSGITPLRNASTGDSLTELRIATWDGSDTRPRRN